jgi:parvulin-like peptidyl-prolyl isomerase
MLDNVTTCPGCGAEVAKGQAEQSDVQESSAVAAEPAKQPVAKPLATKASESAPRGMSAVTKALIAVAVALVAAVGLIYWQSRHSGGLTSLTPEDMSLIAETSLSPTERLKLSSSPEERKKMAEDVKQILAVAKDARDKGVADRPEVQRQLEAMRTLVLAQTYIKKQHDANAKPEDLRPKPEEVAAFLKDPNNAKQADTYLDDLKKLNLVPEGQEITDEIREQFRQQWAPMALLAQKAKAAGIENDRATQLQIQFQQAVALSRIYEAEVAKKLEPTDQDIEQYYAQHPELDPKAARQKAEDILKRAKAGEDFAALAQQYSDDPGSKVKGGDLGWFGRGQMIKEFEDTAFSLKDNEISDIVETKYGFHIIKVTGHRTSTDKDSQKAGGDPSQTEGAKAGQPQEQVHASHILIRTGAPSQNPFAPPQSPLEAAKAAILQEKTKKFMDDIAKRSDIKVPDDFPVKAPEVPPQGLSPHGQMGGPPPDEDEMPEAPDEGSANTDTKSAKPPASAKPKAAPTGKSK